MSDAEEARRLLTAAAVRERAHEMLGLAEAGRLAEWRLDRTKMAGAADLVAEDPQLQAGTDELKNLMKAMYEARNAEIHGDGEPYGPLYLLSGAATDSLPKMLDDAERVMRRAVLIVLEDYARPKQP